jgi:hypothetical protein
MAGVMVGVPMPWSVAMVGVPTDHINPPRRPDII